MSAVEDEVSKLRLSYWNTRKNSLYYHAVYQVVSVVGDEAKTILDVGSADTDYINWFGWIPSRTQLNLGFKRTAPEGVDRIKADFLKWTPPQEYDVVLCLQVLEHVPDAETFCERLKSAARHLVVSVPYKWRAGGHKEHVHDPVDEAKMFGWMKRKPNHSLVVPEPFGPRRYIAYYNLEADENERIPRETSRALIAKRA